MLVKTTDTKTGVIETDGDLLSLIDLLQSKMGVSNFCKLNITLELQTYEKRPPFPVPDTYAFMQTEGAVVCLFFKNARFCNAMLLTFCLQCNDHNIKHVSTYYVGHVAMVIVQSGNVMATLNTLIQLPLIRTMDWRDVRTWDNAGHGLQWTQRGAELSHVRQYIMNHLSDYDDPPIYSRSVNQVSRVINNIGIQGEYSDSQPKNWRALNVPIRDARQFTKKAELQDAFHRVKAHVDRIEKARCDYHNNE